jgi:hypothetical protein
MSTDDRMRMLNEPSGGRVSCVTHPSLCPPACAEMHLVIGAGKTDGAMDAANLLKPMLARGGCLAQSACTEKA